VKRLVLLVGFWFAIGWLGCRPATPPVASRHRPTSTTRKFAGGPHPRRVAAGMHCRRNHPCSLLSSGRFESSLAFRGNQAEGMVGTRALRARFASADFSMAVGHPNERLDSTVFQVSGETLHSITVGKHQAEQYANSTTYYIAIGVI